MAPSSIIFRGRERIVEDFMALCFTAGIDRLRQLYKGIDAAYPGARTFCPHRDEARRS